MPKIDPIKKLRKEIDAIDVQMMSLCRKRIQLVHRMWKQKKKLKMGRIDKVRETQIVKKYQKSLSPTISHRKVKKWVRTLLKLAK